MRLARDAPGQTVRGRASLARSRIRSIGARNAWFRAVGFGINDAIARARRGVKRGTRRARGRVARRRARRRVATTTRGTRRSAPIDAARRRARGRGRARGAATANARGIRATTTRDATTRDDATAATIELALREPGDAFAIARATPRGGALDAREAAAARDAGATRASDGAWTAPAGAVRAIRDALVRRTNARVLDVPGMAMRCAEVRFEEDAARAYARGVPKALDAKMFEFQRTGVMYALRRRGRVLIGDEMGLGKTVQACALLACYREECPALILVPTSSARGVAKRAAVVARRRGRRHRVRGGGERGVETRRRASVRYRAVLARREASLEIAREAV